MAILLCKFNDNATEPFGGGKTFYEEMFTSAGSGKHNMVDYFRDVSHGNVDLSGTMVFGWFTLDKSRSDYGSGEQIEPVVHDVRISLATPRSADSMAESPPEWPYSK